MEGRWMDFMPSFQPQMLDGWGAYHDSMSGEASGKAWADAWARKATMVRVNALAPCACRTTPRQLSYIARLVYNAHLCV